MKISKTNEHKSFPWLQILVEASPHTELSGLPGLIGGGGVFWSISSLKVKSSSAFTLFQNLSFQSPS